MTIKDYLAILRQRWLIAVIAVALSASTAVMISLRQAPEYEAVSRFLLYPRVSNGIDAVAVLYERQEYKGVGTEAEIMRSESVAARVIELLDLEKTRPDITSETLIARINIHAATEVLYIAAKDGDPRLARDIANALPEAYMDIRRDQLVEAATKSADKIGKRLNSLGTELATIEGVIVQLDQNTSSFFLAKTRREQILSQMANLELQRASLLDTSPLKTGLGQFIQKATLLEAKKTNDPVRTGVLGLIVGIPLALGLSLLVEAMSDTIKTKEEAEKILTSDVIGVIPLSPDWRSNRPYLVTREAPYSAAAEAYRTLRVNLDSRTEQDERRQILFTSPGMGEGKTLSSANLAVAFAESGRSVLLVSADLRRPRLHSLFDVEPSPGLADVVQGRAVTEDSIVEPIPNLYLLPSGTADGGRPEQLLNRSDISDVLGDMVLPRPRDRRVAGRNGDGQGSYGRPSGNGGQQSEDQGESGETGDQPPKVRNVVGVEPNLVLLDTPSVLGASEVSAMAGVVDGVVLVIHAGVTRRQAAARATEQIRRAGGKITGIVLVGVKASDDYSVYPPQDTEERSESAWTRVLSGLRR